MFRELGCSSFVLLVTSLAACGGSAADDRAEPVIEAEVTGTVTLTEGDCMPVTTPERCRVRRIATRVEAYRAIRLDQQTAATRFAVPPNTKPVRTTTSGEDGRFSLVLPEGRYTIITFYEGSWYPISSTGDGEWAPVEVNAAWREDIEISIDRATS